MIRFNQPRYILPLIVLPFIYVFYFFYDYIVEDEEAPIIESTTLNPSLPDPFLNEDNLKDKFDAFQEAHKNNRNFSAIQEIDRREEKQIKENQAERIVEPGFRQDNHARSGRYSTPPKMKKVNAYEEQMKLFRAQMSYVDSLLEIPSASLTSTMKDKGKRGEGEKLQDTRQKDEEDGVAVSWRQEAEEVAESSKVKANGADPLKVQKNNGDPSPHFNTLQKDQCSPFIRAVIDEDLNVKKTSRIRLRLLESITIEKHTIPAGHHVYGLITAFKPQRVEIEITSLLYKGQILEVSLNIYDLDGMKGVYVPDSEFRELINDIGENMVSGQQLQIDQPPDNQMQFMMDLAKDALSASTRAASRTIRKQKAKLKYNSQVYLVNQN